MPLPSKRTGISRFVADQLNSAKQGATLVVENGFPSLKRSSKKKKMKNSRNESESVVDDSVIGDPITLFSSYPPSPAKRLSSRGSFFADMSRIHLIVPSPTFSAPICEAPRPSDYGSLVSENGLDAPVCVEDEIRDDGKAVSAKKVFVGILKILFLVVLALGIKQFAIGLTASAFLLFVMNLLRKCLCRLLKQSQLAYVSFRFFLEQVVCNPKSMNEIEPTCSMEEEYTSTENETEDDDDEDDEDDEDDDEDDDEEEEEEEEETNSKSTDSSTEEETATSQTSLDHLLPKEEIQIAKLDAGSRSFQLRSETFDNSIHCRSLRIECYPGLLVDEKKEEEAPMDINRNHKNRNGKMKLNINKLWVSKKKQKDSTSQSDSDHDGEEEVADEEALKILKKERKRNPKMNLHLPQGLKKIMPNKLKNPKMMKMKKKKTLEHQKKKDRTKEEHDSLAIDNLYEQESCSSSSISDDDQELVKNEAFVASSSDEDTEMVKTPERSS